MSEGGEGVGRTFPKNTQFAAISSAPAQVRHHGVPGFLFLCLHLEPENLIYFCICLLAVQLGLTAAASLFLTVCERIELNYMWN